MRGQGTVFNPDGSVRSNGIWGPQGYVSPAVSQAAPFVSHGPLNPPLPSTRSPHLASSSMTYASKEYGTIGKKSDKNPPMKTKRTFMETLGEVFKTFKTAFGFGSETWKQELSTWYSLNLTELTDLVYNCWCLETNDDCTVAQMRRSGRHRVTMYLNRRKSEWFEDYTE